ncbi:MAG: catalase [Mucilaginibacter sp.]|uniref:catalase n=1 Tax=Mucilaginibacter sp. TaxID=1882438 RepID=UPI0031A71587
MAVAASNKETSKPTTLDKYLKAHSAARIFLTTQKLPASFASINYFGVNAFKFTNAKGESCFIRYQLLPEEGERLLTKEKFDKAGASYMIDEIQGRVRKQPVVFKMYAQIADKNDVIDNPSIAWPSSRKRVLLGTLTINKVSSNSVHEDKSLLFIPNNVPDGIKGADPMIDVRSKAYPISFSQRQ